MTHQLTKKLQHLKKKIKQFEEQFEKERNYKVKEQSYTPADGRHSASAEAVISHPVLCLRSRLVLSAALSRRQGS